MNCHQAQDLFDDRLDHQLDPALLATWEAHLTTCGICRAEWRGYQNAWNLAARLPAVDPSIGFTARTMRRLNETPSRIPDWIRSWFGWRGVVLAAASACLAVAAILLLSYPSRQLVLDPIGLYVSIQQNDYLADYDVIEQLHELTEESP